MGFFDGTPGGGTLGDYAKTELKDGIVGAAGLLINDKYLAAPIAKVVGNAAGKYAGPVEGFLAGLLYRYIGAKAGHDEMGRSAATAVFSYKLAAAFSTGPLDPPATHGTIGARSASAPWQSLSPIPLSGRMSGAAGY